MLGTLDLARTPIDTIRHNFSVFDENDLYAAEASGPCESMEEAKAKSLGAAKASVPDLDKRPKNWRNSLLKALNDPIANAELEIAVKKAAPGDRTTMPNVKILLNVLAGFSSFDGTDPVFPSRDTLVAATGLSLTVVGRCIAAAVRAGFLSEGFQQRWLKTLEDGTQRWCGGSAMRMLLFPAWLAEAIREKKEAWREKKQRRVDARKRQQHDLLMEQRRVVEVEQRRRVEALIDTSRTPVAVPVAAAERPVSSTEAITSMRAALE